MKIALVNHNLGSGGAEKIIHDMAIELRKKGEDVTVVLLTSKNGVYDNVLAEKGIEVIHLSDEWDIYSPKNIFRLARTLKDYDIVHTNTYSSQLWTGAASYFLPKKIRYITTEHSTSNNRRGKWYFKILDKWMYSRYEKIISITEATQKNLQEWIEDNRAEKFKIIQNGIKLENFFNAKKISREEISRELTEKDKLLIMVASFSKQKDQMTLVKALRFLDENIKIIFVGEGDTGKIREEAEKQGMKERIIYLGFRKDVPALLKSSDVSVLSSHWEGFGLAAAESMATGVPTIASDVEGLKEVVIDGGILFEKGNPQDLGKKVNEILQNRDYYKLISEKGIEKSKKYSIENTVDSYLGIYKGN